MNLQAKFMILGLSACLLAACGQQTTTENTTSESKTESVTKSPATESKAEAISSEVSHPTTAPEPSSKLPESHLVDPSNIKDTDFFVDATWLKKAQEENKDLVVVEGAYGNESYQKGHIPGAVLVDTNDVESLESDWNLLPADQLVKTFLDKGITKDTPIVVYGDDINAACRVAFAAYYLGVDDVKILDGKKAVWEKAGYELSTDEPEVKAATDFGAEYPVRKDEFIGTSDDLLAAKTANPDLLVVSIRSFDEYAGKTSGYDYIDNAGEIDGALWAMASESSADVNYIANLDGSIRDPEYVLENWAKWGITKDKAITFYCGTGWRNTTVFFMAKQAGFKNISVHDGGWYEWDMKHQKDPGKYPVQIGVPGTADFKEEK